MEVDAVLADFEAHRGTYGEFGERLRGLLVDLLSEHGISVHAVSARTKTRESLARKLSRNDSAYTHLTQVTDLAGVRVTTFFADDVDRVGRLIESEFNVDRDNTVDRRALIDSDRFGYLSLHYVVRLSAHRAKLTENRRYPALKAEIQVRSILQHAWAEIEHDLGYKAAVEVPRHIRRRFSRIAGLLELADQEFEDIRRSLADYERAVPAEIIAKPQDVQLDKASVLAFIAEDPSVARIDAAVAAILKAEIEDRGSDDPGIGRLRLLGLETISELRDALAKRESTVIRFAHQWLAGSSRATIRQGTALFYLRYVLLGERKDRVLAKKVLANVFSAKGTKDDLVTRVFDVYDRAANAG